MAEMKTDQTSLKKRAGADYISRLRLAHVSFPEEEAKAIVSCVLGQSYAGSSDLMDQSFDQTTSDKIENFMQRRIAGEPLALILGSLPFYGLKIYTARGVSCPVSQMEDLVKQTLLLYKDDLNKTIRILDLGTGTGCLLLALLRFMPNASGIGVDICEQAILLARKNAAANKMETRATFLLNDWGKNMTEQFDLIICNPPAAPKKNIPHLPPSLRDHDPIAAIDGGKDGLDFFRQAAKRLETLAKPNALCVFHVHHVQREASLFRKAGFSVETKLYCCHEQGETFVEPCCIVVVNDKHTLSWFKRLCLFVLSP